MADREDLDAFLTGVESKLRGPFSSLDLAKAISTTALRGSMSPKEYLEMIGKVVGRTDKVIQLRILVSLLGLEGVGDVSDEIYKVLQQTQDSSSHEEWVRTISGLIQGILFYNPSDDSSRETCRGHEAKTLLRQTCDDIFKRVLKAQAQAQNSNDKDAPADMNIFFTPYRYSLLEHNVLEKLVPESQGNPHFAVNARAQILQVDHEMELQRAKEEQEHKGHLTKKTGNTGSNPGVVATTKAPGLPGFRPTKLTSSSKGSAKSSSGSAMFMPSKKPTVGNQNRAKLQKTQLHTRKPGAARAQLMKNSLKERMASRVAGSAGKLGSGSGGGGRSAALQKSKMKMIDVSEVNTLNKEQAARGSSSNLSKKRKIMEAAAKNGLVSAATKKTKVSAEHQASEEASSTERAPASESSSKEQSTGGGTAETTAMEATSGQASSGVASEPHAPVPPPPPVLMTDWKAMLKDRSNKLSSEDRFRIMQFFEQKYNPTPDQPVYKMKLHESRTTDPSSGQAIKETFYLELNYETFDHKTSKKTKRY